MASIDTSSMSNDVVGRIQRTEAYAEQVRKMFALIANKIAALRVTPPKVDNGEMYSFDGDTIRIRQDVEQLLRQLHSVVVTVIERGVSVEWEKADEASKALIKRVYGSKLLNSNVFRGWNSRNNAAQEEFIKRSDRGMNLSQRVWKSCRQLRDEMEVALTISIGEGEAAGTISRRIRQYLNDPDLMFRRFQYKVKEPMRDDKGNIVYGKDGKPKMVDKLDKNGHPIWAKKWKKRVIDHSTGKVSFIDYDKDSYHDQWTGKGYYKSAAMNAMRVARTETNIAYRRADHERWLKLDFVLGVRVQLSKNHPEYDICDELQGDYPKDFVFDGWHPQCFCYATPILVDPEEMLKRNEALANGVEYTPKGDPITDVPQGFKDWCVENQEKILASRVRGTDPYFVRNNFGIVDRIVNPQNYKPAIAADIDDPIPPMTTAQIAAKRIAARTPESVAEVRERWQQHRQNEINKAIGELQGKGWKPLSEIERIKDKGKRLELMIKNYEILTNGSDDYDVDKRLLSEGKLNDIEKARLIAEIKRYDLSDVKGMDILAEIHKMDIKKIPFEWLGDIKKLVRETNSIPLDKIATENLDDVQQQTINHLRNISKLAKDKTALFFGLEKLSTKTPQEFFSRWISKDLSLFDELPSKELFDGLKYYVRLGSTNNGAQCVNIIGKNFPWVEISNQDYFKSPKVFRCTISHEFGHAYEIMNTGPTKGMWRYSDKDLRKDFDNLKYLAKDDKWVQNARDIIRKELNAARNLNPSNERISALKSKLVKIEEDYKKGTMSENDFNLWQKYIQAKIDNEMNISTIRYKEILEVAGALSDIVQSMHPQYKQVIGCGGHSVTYFRTGGKDLGEFIAHCSESRYMDFGLIKRAAPEIYNLLQKYAKKYWGA